MKQFAVWLVAVGLTLNVVPDVARAQLAAMVVPNGAMGPGVMLAGDYSRGLNDESGETNYFGARVGVGLPVFSFWGGLGVVDPGSDVTFGGGAAVRVVKGPLVPVEVALQGGLGFLSTSAGDVVNVPIGVVLVIDVPSPAISVKPWAMPRIHVQRFSPNTGNSQSEVGFGASGGIMIGAPNGVGAHATLDWLTIDRGGSSITPLLFSIGLHYNISVPSLGIM